VLNLLTEQPHARTVMEWLFATLVEPLAAEAQCTGLLEELTRGVADADALADRLGWSRRGVHGMLNSLTAAGIATHVDGRWYGGAPVIPTAFTQIAAAVDELQATLKAGLLEGVAANGTLPPETPRGLVTLGIAADIDSQLILTTPGRRYFMPGHDTYLGGYVRYASQLLRHLVPHLGAILRSGQPALRAEKNPGFFGPLVETLFPVNWETACQLADRLAPMTAAPAVLDLGAGSGVWSIALAQRNPRTTVYALDLPPVLEITRAFVQRHGVRTQYQFLPGDFMAMPHWGEQRYDLIYLGYLCCGLSEAENQRLFDACARNLRPGGCVVLVDYLPDPDRTGPLLDVLFAILMLGITESGNTYPQAAYETWCRDAGLAQLEWITMPGAGVPILLARNIAGQRSPIRFGTGLDQAADTPGGGNHQHAATPERKQLDLTPSVSPGQIIETTFAFAQSCILLAAIELKLFTWIAHGHRTPADLARRAGASEPALIRLLGALSAMGFVQVTTDGYTLTPLSEHYLVADQDTYIGDVARQIRQEWDAWIHLTDVVRTGRAARWINEDPLGGPFFAQLVEHLFPIVYPIMHRVCAQLVHNGMARGARVVDLGAGTAPGAIAVLELDPQARAVAIDFAPVLARARAQAQERGVADRMEYWAEDLATVELPAASFDLAIASHTFRVLGEEVTRRLIAQCYQGLKPGGKLVIVETYKEPDRDWKLFPHIVAVNMLVNTRHGDAFSSRQLRDWLRSTGFTVDEWVNYGPDPILVAQRA